MRSRSKRNNLVRLDVPPEFRDEVNRRRKRKKKSQEDVLYEMLDDIKIYSIGDRESKLWDGMR